MVKNPDQQICQSFASMKRNKKSLFFIISMVLAVLASSCATMRIDPSNRAEQVSVTFDKTIK